MLFGRERLLSPTQLQNLDQHKYSCQSDSVLDPYMQPWWNWLVGRCPLWLAPNLITLAGLAVNIATTLILVYYNPDAKGSTPQWACLLAGLGLFIYQSLDAIDGKQARRTGSSSPLGELFDHGCDSVSVVFVVVGVATMTSMGESPMMMFVVCFTAIALFYIAHWQTFVSGTLKFGKIDVTEEQFCVISLYVIGAIFGSDIWNMEISNTGYKLKVMLVVMGVGVTVIHLVGSFGIILTGGVGKNGSSVAGTSVLSPSIPLALVVVPAFVIYRKSLQHVYETHPVLYVIAFATVASKVTCKLVLAHMTRSELEYSDSSMIGPAMLFLNQYFNTYFQEYYVLWVCLIWGLVDFLDYWRKICTEICDHMGIYCFRIKQQSAAAAAAAPAAGPGRWDSAAKVPLLRSSRSPSRDSTESLREVACDTPPRKDT
ncbi:cholinephosphotransferase 1-like isoform X2 [Amphibalanus amphitrite]|uniref:cholinephosphotransferase 1-like isoform X2 n=1 Tax=Amphibalanus amphitrite TaxID=1232801 RepID=UPI001C9286B0|nr:cholinephosphotransferase 1-like isoform X2 [Amphibalanus amphitrite]XP_043202272.1 cholinephosphotransferase 1-like isoform X2 [Amphibalanus amphitrite]